MRVIILGYGVSGQAAERHFLSLGMQPIILQNDQPFDFQDDDLVIKSPGIRPDHPWVRAAKNFVEEAELGLQRLKGKVLGITGSNGKTTTTLLVAHVTGGIACGNVGKALLDVPEAEIYVVELSSFQLMGIKGGSYFDAACILNITTNHLDWHRSWEEYVGAKLHLADCMKKNAPLFVSDKKYGFEIFDERLESIFGVSYRDERFHVMPHDRQNIAAAFALCQSVGVTKEQFLERLATFKKPPHRMEFVATQKGIDFINDSKATSIDAVKKALASVRKPVHLIAGGVDKGGSFRELLAIGSLRSVFALGQAAERIENELKDALTVTKISSLEEGVTQARLRAQAGECVLLSPGCSSYDQFRNFEERGEKFKEFVLNEGKG